MSEEKANPAKPEEKKAETKPLISVIATDDSMIKAYLEDAASDRKVDIGSGAAHQLAVFRFIADSCKIDGEMRAQAWKQFAACPGGFGSNASQLAQKLKIRVAKTRHEEEFAA